MATDREQHLRRQLLAAERRAQRADATVARALAAISIGASDDTLDWQRGYQSCAGRVTEAMNGILNGIDENGPQFDVVVYDRITGDVGHREVPRDNYIVIPTGDCSMAAVTVNVAARTHVITMKGVRNP